MTDTATSAWRPMITAPKNGKRILLLMDSGELHVGDIGQSAVWIVPGCGAFYPMPAHGTPVAWAEIYMPAVTTEPEIDNTHAVPSER